MFINAIAAFIDTFTAAIEAAVQEELSWTDMGSLITAPVPVPVRAPKMVMVNGVLVTPWERYRMLRDARKYGANVSWR